MSTTTENASLTLAEEYVREQLTAETRGQTIGYGEEIDVPKMEQCDCVPIRVSTEGRGQQAHKKTGMFKTPASQTQTPSRERTELK